MLGIRLSGIISEFLSIYFNIFCYFFILIMSTSSVILSFCSWTVSLHPSTTPIKKPFCCDHSTLFSFMPHIQIYNKYRHKCTYFFFSVVQQPTLGLSRLILEISSSHTIRHTKPIRTPLNEWSASTRGHYLYNTTNVMDEHPCPQWDSNRNSINRVAADRSLRPPRSAKCTY